MSSHSILLRLLTISLILIGLGVLTNAQVADDAALYAVRRSDRTARDTGTFAQLPAAEHMRRATIYMPNRAFSDAREHWQAVIAIGANEANVPSALFGTGRSYFQERRYGEALHFFERVAREYPQTKDGREGLNSSAATLLRLGRPSEAAVRYTEYVGKYPGAERIESAHLNVIDSFREADRRREAMTWIELTREKFEGTATDKNALFAQLRLHLAASEWRQAAQTADELLSKPFQSGVLTTADEGAYLRGYSLGRSGRNEEAMRSYLALPASSYYGRLATEKLSAMKDVTARLRAAQRAEDTRRQ